MIRQATLRVIVDLTALFCENTSVEVLRTALTTCPALETVIRVFLWASGSAKSDHSGSIVSNAMRNRRTAAGDMLYSAAAIAAYLGLRRRQVFHLTETGRLPYWREGRTICSRRSILDEWLAARSATPA